MSQQCLWRALPALWSPGLQGRKNGSVLSLSRAEQPPGGKGSGKDEQALTWGSEAKFILYGWRFPSSVTKGDQTLCSDLQQIDKAVVSFMLSKLHEKQTGKMPPFDWLLASELALCHLPSSPFCHLVVFQKHPLDDTMFNVCPGSAPSVFPSGQDSPWPCPPSVHSVSLPPSPTSLLPAPEQASCCPMLLRTEGASPLSLPAFSIQTR